MDTIQQAEEQLKYPIGRFQWPVAATTELRGEWLRVLSEGPDELEAIIKKLHPSHYDKPYRPGGWTVRQLVHHIADSHMNAYVRIKLALTEDNPIIKLYDEKKWAELPDTLLTPLTVSVELLKMLHTRLVELLGGLSDEQWARTCNHPGNNRDIAVWEFAALYAWHIRHHIAHISRMKTD